MPARDREERPAIDEDDVHILHQPETPQSLVAAATVSPEIRRISSFRFASYIFRRSTIPREILVLILSRTTSTAPRCRFCRRPWPASACVHHKRGRDRRRFRSAPLRAVPPFPLLHSSPRPTAHSRAANDSWA